MKFNLFGKSKPIPEVQKKSTTKSYVVQRDSFLAIAFGGGNWITASQAAKLYRSTAAVATAVDMIASAIKQINPVIKTQDGKYLDKHPVLTLLKKPNGFDDWTSFCETLSINFLLKHDSIILSSGNVKFSPSELWPKSLQGVSILPAPDDYPDMYIVVNGVLKGNYKRIKKKGNEIRFYDTNLQELYHIRGYSSRNSNIDSDSPLLAAAMEARQLIQGKYHNVKLLENGARLSLLVTFNDDDFVDDDEHESRKKRLNEQFGGGNATGGIGVISGADIQNIKEFGKSNKDMDFVKLEKLASYAIFLRYQIPLALVTTEASTFNNLKTGIELLYDNAVIPNAKVIFSGLSRLLLPRYNMDPTKEEITFNPESIEPLKKRTLDEVHLRQKIGIEPTNELRSLLPGREPIEGGDVLYIKSNMMPIGTDTHTDDNNST